MVNGRIYIGSAINFPRRIGERTNVSKKKMAKAKAKPIEQHTLDGELVKEWASGKEVQNKLGWSQGNINKVCLGKCKTAYGFVWKFK